MFTRKTTLPLSGHCLKPSDFERISQGIIRRENVDHLDRCSTCRASLFMSEESMGIKFQSSETQRQRLAAATLQSGATIQLTTKDGCLTCDIEILSHGDYHLTVVAEQSNWGEVVVLWPGPAAPQLLTVGESTVLPQNAFYSFDFWRIGKHELSWNGIERGLPEQETVHNRLRLHQDAGQQRYDWTTPVAALLATQNIEGKWLEVTMPWFVATEPTLPLLIFTSLSAVELCR